MSTPAHVRRAAREAMTRVWWIDGRWRTVHAPPRSSLLRVLREHLRVTSLVEGCGEGECGACTVLLDDAPVLACLLRAGQIRNGSRILTAAGASQTGLGAAIAESLAAQGAVQCGACTPGILVSTFALLRAQPRPTEDEIRAALSGHLCRCTGYAQIVAAIRGLRRPAGTRAPSAWSRAWSPGPAPAAPGGPVRGFAVPTTLADALDFRRRHPGCTILAGGTDLGVRWNAQAGAPLFAAADAPREGRPAADDLGAADAAVKDAAVKDATAPHVDVILHLGAIARLRGIRLRGERLHVGAMTTVAAVARSRTLARCAPGLAQAARLLGARQIRESATIGGNIVNASPAADLVPPLLAAGATLQLAAARGRREIPIAEFYRGYKELALAPDEIVIGVRIPALRRGEREGYGKLGTRRAQSIAKVSVAARLRLSRGRVTEVSLAAGSVAATVVALPRAAALLRGRAPTRARRAAAAAQAASETRPIDDLRSTAGYRRGMVAVLLADLLAELSASGTRRAAASRAPRTRRLPRRAPLGA